MPIYEYQCQACGHQFETTQRITESPLTDCPACSRPRLERLISATSFLLKGSGWYKDGYGSPAKERTESQVTDRLQKAIDDDKKKTAEPSSTAESTPASSSADSSPSSSSASSSPASSGAATASSSSDA